nr:hypothetical protein [Tanacetum cinerariifolium]
SLTTSESVHAGVGTRAGIEILAVVRYAWCGSGVAADSSVSNGSVSSADGACGILGPGRVTSWINNTSVKVIISITYMIIGNPR